METKKRELKWIDYAIIIGFPIVLIILVIQFVLNYNNENLIFVIFVIFGYSCLLKSTYKKRVEKKKNE